MKGYVTMTGDLPHEGHFNMLKLARGMCMFLIVGLTTDSVAALQKRPTTLSYEQRKAIFEHCRFVDAVVAHNGEPKSVACLRLGVDVCFTCAEEYYDSPEFDELRFNAPDVKIIGIPRSPNVSSTQYLARIQKELILNSFECIAHGVSGPILKIGSFVIKPLPFSTFDQGCQDHFGFFEPHELEGKMFVDCLPRQYKHLNQKNLFPNIAGIAPQREIDINRFFQSKPWSVFERVLQPPALSTVSLLPHLEHQETESTNHLNLHDFAQFVAEKRSHPIHTSWIVTRYAGITLDQFGEMCTDSSAFDNVIRRVLHIIEEMESVGVLHGDIHSGNVLVDPKTLNVSIIDWGWCSATFFNPSENEERWLYKRLAEHWDRLHFIGSCRFDPKLDRCIEQSDLDIWA